MAAGVYENHNLLDTHNLAPGMLARPGICVVLHRDPPHTGPHEVRIASPMVLPECNACRRVRFSRKCDISPPIEECEFFSAAARRQSLICSKRNRNRGLGIGLRKAFSGRFDMSKTDSKFGDVIRKRRRQMDLTQEEVARRVNASVPYIGLLESGQRHPSQKLIAKLAKALGLDKSELFFLANPTAKAFLVQDSKPNKSPWDAFRRDERIRQIHKITDQEMEILSQVALMGEVRSTYDFLFVLNTIRHALEG